MIVLLLMLLTYCMEQSPSWKTNWFLQLVKKFPAFLGLEGSSPYPQAPATSTTNTNTNTNNNNNNNNNNL